MVKKNNNKKVNKLEGGRFFSKKSLPTTVNSPNRAEQEKERTEREREILNKMANERNNISEFNKKNFIMSNGSIFYLLQIDNDQSLKFTRYEKDKNSNFTKYKDCKLKTIKISNNKNFYKNYSIAGKINSNNNNTTNKNNMLTIEDLQLISNINNNEKKYDLKIQPQAVASQPQAVAPQPQPQAVASQSGSVQGGKNSQYIMTKQGKRKIHVGKRGGKYYIMNKKKVYVK